MLVKFEEQRDTACLVSNHNLPQTTIAKSNKVWQDFLGIVKYTAQVLVMENFPSQLLLMSEINNTK